MTMSDTAEGIDTGRRAMLKQAVAVPISLAVAGALSSAAAASADPLRSTIVINTLGALVDREVPRTPEEQRQSRAITEYTLVDSVTERSLRHARESGMTAVNITLGYVDGPVEPFEHTMRELGRWNRILERHADQLILVRSTKDIVRAKSENKIGVIFGFQNGVMVGNDASRVQVFADLGVRVFQMTYNKATQLGDGSIAPENRGLTPLGREVIAQLNESRVITDLSHSGQNTCLDAVRVSQRPITLSHTGCRALVDVPRNKTDEELRLVAEKGGYVGIYFSSFLRAQGPARSEDVVAHIEHALKICGEDHVGIGTDGLVSPVGDLAEYRKRQRERLEQRLKDGIAAPGENSDRPTFVVDLTGPEQFRKLAELLGKRGHSWARIEKILGGNFLRVAREVWGA
jgi:membrane dipeptidase